MLKQILGGGGRSRALDASIDALVAEQVAIVVAAGNDGADACNDSPAGNPNVISVAAAGQSVDGMERADFSNYGKCTHLYAPGVAIRSVQNGGKPKRWLELDGTSMASPHVAGAAAAILSRKPMGPTELKDTILRATKRNFIQNNYGDTPNRFLYLRPDVDCPEIRPNFSTVPQK